MPMASNGHQSKANKQPGGSGALHSVSVTTASSRKQPGNGVAAGGAAGDENAALVERTTARKGVRFASYSSAHGYRDNAPGEWKMLYRLQYEEDSEEKCVCWQRVQASHSIGRYKACMGSPFLKGMLAVNTPLFGIPLTFGGNAMLWAGMQHLNHLMMLSGFPDGFASIMHQVSWWVGAVLMLVLLAFLTVKCTTCRAAGMIEAIYHERNAFLFTPMLTLIVLHLSFPYAGHSSTSAHALFWIAFVLQVGGALMIYRQWLFDENRRLSSAPPSFLMGAVGWFFCAILAVRASLLGFGWFCFSIGLLFYLFILMLMMQSLPSTISTKGARWTIFLNIAPPAVASSFIAVAFGPGALGIHGSESNAVGCALVQLLLAYFSLFLAIIFFLEFSFRFFPRRYEMELWATAFPTVALAGALLDATQLPFEEAPLNSLVVPNWLAFLFVATALLITLALSVWLLIALWRKEPKFQLSDPLLHEMHQNLQKRARQECENCRAKRELGLDH